MFVSLFLLSFTLPESVAGVARKNFQTLTPRSFVASQKKDPYRARIYVECGADTVFEADYGGDHVTLFQTPNPLAAMCAYGTDKTLDGSPIPSYDGAQSEGHKQPGSWHLWRGTLYLKVRGKTGEKLLKHLAELIASPSERDPAIEHMRQLPGNERIPGSDRYIAKNVYGWTSFARGYSADYGCGDASLSIANIDTQPGEDTISTMVLDEAVKRNYVVSEWRPKLADDAPKLPKYAMQAVPASGPTLYLLKGTGHRLVAIDADTSPTNCMALFEELLRMLK